MAKYGKRQKAAKVASFGNGKKWQKREGVRSVGLGKIWQMVAAVAFGNIWQWVHSVLCAPRSVAGAVLLVVGDGGGRRWGLAVRPSVRPRLGAVGLRVAVAVGLSSRAWLGLKGRGAKVNGAYLVKFATPTLYAREGVGAGVTPFHLFTKIFSRSPWWHIHRGHIGVWHI